MIASEYHADLKEVQSDPALAALLSASAQRAPFDRIDWWRGLAEHCGLSPLLAVARDETGLAVLPLQRKRHELHALSNWYTFRFRPLISPGSNGPGLLAALARDLAGKCPRLLLGGLPNEDGTADLVETAFRREGWRVLRSACDTNHYLSVGGRSWEQYLSGRPGPLRTTIKRKAGKLDVQVLTRFDASIWSEYEAIYAESWKPEEGSPAFLRAFAEQEGQAGRLRLGVAQAQGQAIAAQMWTVEGGVAFIHKLAHRESARALSPGSVLSAALFRHAIDEDRVHAIDFGTGDDPYKRDWMEQARPRFRLDMFRARDPQNWPLLARRAIGSLAARSRRG